jgi:polysaccharide pyruvyl transferase WcaK-like protein
VLLIGGGDIVIPWGGGRYWERAFLRRPVFVAGVAVPTWGTTRPERLDPLRAFFRHPNVRYIGVRDPVSAGWIRDRLEPLAPVITTPDLVCSLSLPAVERPMDPPIFGVAVRRRRGKDDLSAVRSLCRRAIELGYRVRQIVLATGAVRLRDAEVTAELGIAGAEVVASDDLTTITRAIGECTAMASMKFHGVVVASMYGIPCFVLMPTAKNRYFVEALGRLDLLSHFGDHELADRLTRDPRPIDPAVVDRLRRDAVASLVDLRGRMIAAAAGRDAVPSAAQVEVDAAPAATTADQPDPQPAGPVR